MEKPRETTNRYTTLCFTTPSPSNMYVLSRTKLTQNTLLLFEDYIYISLHEAYIYKKLQRFVVPYVLRLFRKWRGCVRANKFELSLRLIDSRGGHTMHTRVHEVNLSPPSFLLSLSFSLDFKRSRGRIAKYVAWIEKREEETKVVTAAEETSIHHTLEKGRKSIDLGFRDDVEKPRTTRWIRFVREARALLSLRATGRGRERKREKRVFKVAQMTRTS